jgi:hypothetical protein
MKPGVLSQPIDRINSNLSYIENDAIRIRGWQRTTEDRLPADREAAIVHALATAARELDWAWQLINHWDTAERADR